MKTPVSFKFNDKADFHVLSDSDGHGFYDDDEDAKEVCRRVNVHDLLIAALKSIEEWTHVDPAKSSAPEDCYTDALVEIRKIAERVVRVPEAMGYLLPEKT